MNDDHDDLEVEIKMIMIWLATNREGQSNGGVIHENELKNATHSRGGDGGEADRHKSQYIHIHKYIHTFRKASNCTHRNLLSQNHGSVQEG